jgi:hypothetical protein
MRVGACMVVAVAVIACSRPRQRDNETPTAVATPRDARATPIDSEPPWLAEALARGGPGLCASVSDANVLVWRRDANNRLVERLEFNAEHGREPAARLELSYDRTGRMTKVVDRGSTSHAFDSTTDLWYDKTGRVERTREHHDDASALLPGDVNVTYRWKGKRLASVVGRFVPEDRDVPTKPLVYALAFAGTVEEARYYDGSSAPQPQNVYNYTYDERGRLVEVRSTGWSDPSRHEQLEWDADDQLTTIRGATYTTQFVWRDHHLVTVRYLDQSGNENTRFELRYDANGRLVERLRVTPSVPRERIASTQLDRERGELVTTYVTEDPTPLARWSYRYDCGSASAAE